METVGRGKQGARDAWELIEADGGQDLLGFGTVADGVWQTARFRSPAADGPAGATAQPRLARAWRSACCTSSCWISCCRRALGGQPQCRYVHLLREVTDASAKRSCQLAVLVPPATMQHVEQIAGNLEKMPPKSTYFYPKLLSGLVFNSLKGN